MEKNGIYNLLMKEFENRTSSTVEEETLLKKELGVLETERAQSEVNQAKINVLNRDAELALSVGNAKMWEQKRGEIIRLQDRQREVLDLVSQKSERLKAIRAEKARIAEKTLAALYPQIRESCFRETEELISMLESVVDGLHQFATQTGAKVWKQHIDGLVPESVGPTRPLRERLDKFFS